MVFSFASILTEITMNILRTTGDMIASMKIQLLGALSNIVLDPILIFGLLFVPAMGVTGAAVATVGGQFIAMVYAFFLLRRNKAGIRLKLSSFRFKAQIIKEIFKVATPAILMMLLNSFMIIGINMILAGFSATSVAVFGIYFKLQSFIYMPVFGLTQGMMPVVGYNFGAQKLDRVASALKVTNIYAFLIMAMGTFIFFAFPRPLLFLFNSSEEMYAMGVVCLRIISAGFIFSGGVIVYSSYFQAIGTAVYSLVITLCRQIFILLPLAFALSRMIGVAGVWTAFPVSEGLSLIMSLLFLYRSRACCSDKNQLRRAA
ncbi:MAG: MATE family efflux transporter, partial [Spirochaetales bacterium]|nr:MATE family efflux transporter [Spirochaetales bacterium]